MPKPEEKKAPLIVELPSENRVLHVQLIKMVLEGNLTADQIAQLGETLSIISKARRWNNKEVLAQLSAFAREDPNS